MQKLSTNAKGGIVFSIILLFVIGWMLHAAGGSSSTIAPSKNVTIGDQGFLREGASSSVSVAVSKDAAVALLKALSANDEMGFNQLEQSGQVYEVKSGTKVLVIDSSWGYDQIRFFDGPHAGESAWVEYEMVKAN